MSAPRELSNRWQERFAFYDTYGIPGSTPAARDAYRALPFGQKIMLNSNFLAFLFGPIYFFVKGMWRKGLTLLGMGLAVGVVITVADLSDTWSRLAGFGFAGLALSTANYAYYLHVAKNSSSWNLFEGFGRAR
ncbi:DUF2628 domain-containing protein [Nocardia uniformis]|uniref:DUF2628 domain-containing protein n=1 Tax=Nocardia uniformis TaxID=53432 RepID=A0A849CEG0_9NOCA|nr:DUF2628 domain-containing protein [Nocardia uniformis]NNH74707.1 DUF2628 domain-containing protein [Nocardia uniformis]